jgi:SAM-dependent methyltransferase
VTVTAAVLSRAAAGLYYRRAMTLPRMHLFEFNDAAWAPRVLRDTIVEALSRTLTWARLLRGLVAPFEAFLAASGAREVLDLASGAGGPARILASEILRAGRTPPRFVLTDLYPNHDAWEEARAAFPGVIDFEPAPVDATRIPARVAGDRARVIVNAFHHLPPEVAREVLADAVRSSSPIFIAESFERGPWGFLPFVLPGLPALVATPFLSPKDRLAKLLLVWSSPAILAVSLWDGIVSTLRVYSREELLAMVGPSPAAEGSFTWTYGTFAVPFGGTGYYFQGLPPIRGTK